MGIEVDLLINYPKSKRDLKKRLEEKSEEDRKIARNFGKEFFDGTRSQGYGGYNYNSKFWELVVPTFKEYWDLDHNSNILDVGCGKGFMLYDFSRLIPGIKITGIDISEYAIENSLVEIKKNLQVANAKKLPFKNKSFDAVVSINTIHNLSKVECRDALKEIERVSNGKSFITVDAYRNSEEKEKIFAWNLTAKTILSVEEWKNFFKEVGYTGDYYWFIP